MLESYTNKIPLMDTLKTNTTSLPLIEFSKDTNQTKEIEIMIRNISVTNSKLIDHFR